MRAIIWGLAGLVIAAGVVHAQDNDACLKAAHPTIDAFSQCTVGKAKIAAKSNDTPEDIADAAIASCKSRADELRALLRDPPCSQSDEQAEYAVNGVLDQMRIEVTKTVNEFRGG
jgi:hypothetical protein